MFAMFRLWRTRRFDFKAHCRSMFYHLQYGFSFPRMTILGRFVFIHHPQSEFIQQWYWVILPNSVCIKHDSSSSFSPTIQGLPHVATSISSVYTESWEGRAACSQCNTVKEIRHAENEECEPCVSYYIKIFYLGLRIPVHGRYLW